MTLRSAVVVQVEEGERVLEVMVVVSAEANRIVRAEFNPSELESVTLIKALAAAAISHVNRNGKDARLMALARTAFEEGAMWAVKSATA